MTFIADANPAKRFINRPAPASFSSRMREKRSAKYVLVSGRSAIGRK